MAKLFELACYPEARNDFENFKEKAQLKGWTITGQDNLVMSYPDAHHCKFLCDHDWRDVKALAATVTDCHYIEQTVMPLNIYNGARMMGWAEDEAYYRHTIPKIVLVNGGEVVASRELEATVPPLSGRELKEAALQHTPLNAEGPVSYTHLTLPTKRIV